MIDRRHGDRPSSLSLRGQSRAHAVLRRTVGGALALQVASVEAFAEVCDKVAGEQWRPSDGVLKTIFHWDWSGISPIVPMVLLAVPAGFIGVPFFVKTLGASARGSFMAGVYFKWVSYGLAAFTTLVALFLVNDLMSGDVILRAAAHEGCVTWATNWFAVAATMLVVLLYGGTAWFMRHFARRAEARFRSLVPS